jgi:hypothetical protein
LTKAEVATMRPRPGDEARGRSASPDAPSCGLFAFLCRDEVVKQENSN